MTNKEKYNNLSSIDINSLSSEEIKIAIHEWAEGDSVLESLLWKCYISGVETKQCHSGAMPFIEVSADKNSDKVKNMIDSVCDIDGLRLLITPDGGNPFSGDVFYKAGLGIIFPKVKYRDEGDLVFNKLNNSLDLENIKHNKISSSVINLYNFFREKESELEFKVDLNSNEYEFNIIVKSKLNYSYFNELFSKIGLNTDQKEPWIFKFNSNDINDFSDNLERITNLIISNYSLEIPTKIENGMSFTEEIRVLRRQFILKYGDDVKFKEFKNDFENRFNIMEKDMLNKKISPEFFWNWAYKQIEDTFDEIKVSKVI